MTMNTTWGYVPTDDTWKSPLVLLHTLIEAVSMGGNLLINVGPMGDGSFPPEAVQRLEILASWLHRNGDSVHDVQPGLDLWQFHGPSTKRPTADGGTRVYLHLVSRPYERVVVRGLPVGRITAVHLLDGGLPLAFNIHPRLKDIQAGIADPYGELHIAIEQADLDDLCTVICVDLAPPGSSAR
jgi:alpha-L-fucosidase